MKKKHEYKKRHYPAKKDAVLYVPTPETKAILDAADNKTAYITRAVLAQAQLEATEKIK